MRDNERYVNIHFLLFPDDNIRIIWDIIIILTLLYSAIVAPMRLSFYDDQDNTMAWDIFDVFVDIAYGMDLVFNFFSAYWDEEENLVVSKTVN